MILFQFFNKDIRKQVIKKLINTLNFNDIKKLLKYRDLLNNIEN